MTTTTTIKPKYYLIVADSVLDLLTKINDQNVRTIDSHRTTACIQQIMEPIYEESWTSFDTTVTGRTFSYLDCSNMQNAKGAYVSGLELSVATPLPAQLHNFGVVGSVTFMESQAIYTYGSSIENEGSLFWIRELEDTLRISGQPDLTWSLMPYFQMGRLQARLMATYQGDYLDYAGSGRRYAFQRLLHLAAGARHSRRSPRGAEGYPYNHGGGLPLDHQR